MKLKSFLKIVSKEKPFTSLVDIYYNLQEILDLINNFELLYGVKIELDFDRKEEIKGRWFSKGISEKLLDLQHSLNNTN